MDKSQNYRIWFDMSHTFDSGLNTGIQRVVRNLATHLPSVAETAGISCSPVLLRENVFHDLEQYQNRWGTESFKTWKRSTPRFRQMYVLAKVYFETRKLFQMAVRSRTRIRMEAMDWLVLPDGYWAMDQIWNSVHQVRSRGVQVCAILYDLIPVLHPEFFDVRSHVRFTEYLDRMISDVDLVLCISKAVEKDYHNYADQRRSVTQKKNNQSVASFRLGADFLSSGLMIQKPEPRLLSLLPRDDTPYFLQVGTIEPRKNHMMAIDAMERLWLRGLNVRCVFVGRCGWMTKELSHRIDTHPELNSKLFHFVNLDDQLLVELYRDCKAVLCPSRAEGFGLPLVEGLFAGKQVIASDIPVHREVGGDACVYFDLDAPETLVQLMEECLLDSESMTKKNTIRSESWRQSIITWRQSAQELLAHL